MGESHPSSSIYWLKNTIK